MTLDKPFFTSLEDYNRENLTFRDGIAHVRGKDSIFNLGCPDLDGVFYVNGLKANVLSISQIYDSDCRINFSQSLCELINNEGEVIFTRHRIVENSYTINPSSKPSLNCIRAKFDVIELWNRRLGHINYEDLVHIENKDLVRGIPKLSGQPKIICRECMKDKRFSIGKGRRTNIKPRNQKGTPNTPPRVKQI